MTQQVIQQPPAATAVAGRGATIVVKRIRFVERVPPGAKVLRVFKQPRACVAVEEAVDVADLPTQKAWPEPTDHLTVVFVPKGAAAQWQKLGENWLAPPDQPEAVPPTLIEWDGHKIQWRPGRALVQGRGDRVETTLAALADFAFYEGELRNLERMLEPLEAEAQSDVAHAHRIRYRERKHWDRFREMIEDVSQMRLTYARLEPRLYKGSRNLPIEGRRMMTRLLVRADTEARLEGLNDRLEACEDLYEGANDRVSDYRGYLRGHMLEIAIILFLLLEVVLMAGELYLRYLEYMYMD